jgi:hypothetical protein
MKCPHCGTRNPRKNKFCKACGEELLHDSIPPTAGPTTTIIIRERRGMPGLLWILVGMVLVVALSGLLVWLDVIDVPYALRVRLPDPIGDLVDALENARNPGGVAGSVPAGANLPANQGQLPPQIQPGNQLPAACNEDLLSNYGTFNIETCPADSGVIWLTFKAPLVSDAYDVTVVQFGNTIYQAECSPLFDPDKLPICTWDCFRWDSGELAITIRPAGLSCIVGNFYLNLP